MKNTKTTIKEKIAFLECMQEVIDYALSMQNCYASYDENGNAIQPTEDYQALRWNAYKAVIAILEKEV